MGGGVQDELFESPELTEAIRKKMAKAKKVLTNTISLTQAELNACVETTLRMWSNVCEDLSRRCDAHPPWIVSVGRTVSTSVAFV